MKFEREIEKRFKIASDNLEAEGIIVDESYIRNYGNVCPHCLRKTKIYNDEIRDILTISWFIVDKRAMFYSLCVRCFKHLANLTLDYKKIENNVIKSINDK